MEITIQSLHLQPGKKLLDAIENKFSRIEKIYDRIQSCEVTLKKEKTSNQKSCIAEVKLNVPGKTLFMKEKAETFESALNKVIYEIRQRLAEYKEHLNEVR